VRRTPPESFPYRSTCATDKPERGVGIVSLDVLLLLLSRELHNMSEGMRAEVSARQLNAVRFHDRPRG
jgi:hypothetical protein